MIFILMISSVKNEEFLNFLFSIKYFNHNSIISSYIIYYHILYYIYYILSYIFNYILYFTISIFSYS